MTGSSYIDCGFKINKNIHINFALFAYMPLIEGACTSDNLPSILSIFYFIYTREEVR